MVFADVQKNIVHRDLKLGNMVLNKETRRVTVTNFCLGKHLVSESDLLRDQRGSPAYISPDVLNGKTECCAHNNNNREVKECFQWLKVLYNYNLIKEKHARGKILTSKSVSHESPHPYLFLEDGGWGREEVWCLDEFIHTASFIFVNIATPPTSTSPLGAVHQLVF